MPQTQLQRQGSHGSPNPNQIFSGPAPLSPKDMAIAKERMALLLELNCALLQTVIELQASGKSNEQQQLDSNFVQ